MSVRIPLKRPKGQKPESRDLWPEGKYRVIVDSAEEVNDQYNGLALELIVQGGELQGSSKRFRVFPASEAARTLAATVGLDEDQESAEFNLDELVGTELYVYVGVRDGKKGGRFNYAKQFAPVPARRKP